MKAAFTRAYNKESHKTPYTIRAAPKKGKKGGSEDSQALEEEGMNALEGTEQQQEDEEEDDSIENSAMIKASKKPAKAGASGRGKGGKSKEGVAKEASTAKGKGRGKNRK